MISPEALAASERSRAPKTLQPQPEQREGSGVAQVDNGRGGEHASDIVGEHASAAQSAAPTKTSSSTEAFHLLYSKSKVYVHPTPYARDNVPGYVALLRRGPARPTADGSNIFLAFMPEALLQERDELDCFVQVEVQRGGRVEGTLVRDEGQ